MEEDSKYYIMRMANITQREPSQFVLNTCYSDQINEAEMRLDFGLLDYDTVCPGGQLAVF
jgi:hypothetical protein